MKWLSLLATAVLSLGVGVIVGKTIESERTKDEKSPGLSDAEGQNYRSVNRERISAKHSHRGIGSVGSKPPQGFENQVEHMKALAKKVDFGRGVPDFDALFGIWETAREMSGADIQRALDELDDGGVLQRDGMFVRAMLVMELAKKDGPTAMVYAEKMGGGRRFPAKEMALQAWAKTDPKGAYAWYESHKEGMNPRENMNFQASAIAGLAKEDFEAAFTKAKAVDGLSQRNVLRQLGAVAVMDAEHRDRFTQYVATLENKETVEEVGESMVRQLAQNDVQEALAFVETWPGEDKGELVEEIADWWAQTEPEKALAWRLDKPGAGRDVDGMFGDWARRDSEAARTWLARQERDDDQLNKNNFREAAVRRVMWNDDYPQAAQWADSITDVKERHSSYRSIYRRWSRLDKEGANRWAETLGDAAREAVMPDKRVEAPADIIVPSR